LIVSVVRASSLPSSLSKSIHYQYVDVNFAVTGTIGTIIPWHSGGKPSFAESPRQSSRLITSVFITAVRQLIE
jgi:hypothetical protein